MTHLLVYNVEPASPSMIRSLDRHCKDRVADGDSAIDKTRSHLNVVIVGHEDGVQASIDAFFENGPKPPARQSEAPYLRIVVSASPSYFRPEDPGAVGTWDYDRLNRWISASVNQLKAEHGDDLVYVELHLDEDTPHIHAVVVPTYEKKPRIPGRKKRDESDDEFEARKRVAREGVGVRTAGRSSHPELSKMGSFQRLRERMSVAVEHLEIEYGEDRGVDAPDGKSTRQWVKEQAAALRSEKAALDVEKLAFSESEKKHQIEMVSLAAEKLEFSEFQKARQMEMDEVREAARIEGHKAGHLEARAEISQLHHQVESVMSEITGWIDKVKAFIKAADADLKLVDIAKTIFGDGAGVSRKINSLRKSLNRMRTGDYIGGVAGRLERDQDAKITAEYQLELAKRNISPDVSVPGAEDPIQEARPGLRT